MGEWSAVLIISYSKCQEKGREGKGEGGEERKDWVRTLSSKIRSLFRDTADTHLQGLIRQPWAQSRGKVASLLKPPSNAKLF